jgi:DNA-binding transcriptional LysR family regulator
VAQSVLAQLNSARRAVQENRDAKLRSISFAAPHILSVTFFPEWLQHVQSMLGPTRLSITSDNLPGCCTALEDGRVDLVVCLMDADGGILAGANRRLAIDDKASIVVGRERLIPLSVPGPDGKPLHDLRSSPHASVSYLEYSRECSLGWAVDRKLAGRAGLPHLINLYENSLADGLRRMAISRLGVAWLPLTVTHNDILRGRLVRAGDEDLIVDLDVRLYRPAREIGRKAEELWTKLNAGASGERDLPDLSTTLRALREGAGD